MSASTFKPSIWNRLRNAFFTGLLVIAPATITISVVRRHFVFVDHLLGTTLRGDSIRPHAPNPTTGFLLFYPPETLIPTSLRVEQALKMVVSGGVVNPGTVA